MSGCVVLTVPSSSPSVTVPALPPIAVPSEVSVPPFTVMLPASPLYIVFPPIAANVPPFTTSVPVE